MQDVVIVILAIYLVALFFTIRRDRQMVLKNTAKHISQQLSSPLETAPRSFELSNMSPNVTDTDATDSTMTDSSTKIRRRHPSIMERAMLKRGSLVLKPDDKGKLTDVETGQTIGLSQLCWVRLPTKHSWLAVLFGPLKKGFMSHTDLLTLLFCMVWANLFMSSFVNTVEDKFSVGQKIVNGIVVALLVFPITIIFSVLFYKMPRKYIWISYLLAIIFMLVAATLTLIETLMQDGMVNQPVKLVVTSLMIILFPAAPIIALLL